MNNIANYIREIFLSQLMVVFSWGAHNFKALGESVEGEVALEFEVNGFRHKGGSSYNVELVGFVRCVFAESRRNY